MLAAGSHSAVKQTGCQTQRLAHYFRIFGFLSPLFLYLGCRKLTHTEGKVSSVCSPEILKVCLNPTPTLQSVLGVLGILCARWQGRPQTCVSVPGESQTHFNSRVRLGFLRFYLHTGVGAPGRVRDRLDCPEDVPALNPT